MVYARILVCIVLVDSLSQGVLVDLVVVVGHICTQIV